MLIRSIFPRQSYGLVVPHRAIRRISKWKINWFEYPAAYDLSNFYPFVSARISRTIFSCVRATCNISARNFDFRLSRRHAIWGKWSACFSQICIRKDMGEFILPAFNILRVL